jgi:hypothetical protein
MRSNVVFSAVKTFHASLEHENVQHMTLQTRPRDEAAGDEMANTLDIEELDLSSIAEFLVRATGGGVTAGAIVGLTQFRDLLIEHLSCSSLEAERVLDTMIGLRFVVKAAGVSGGPPLWRVVPAR